jgi:hypothetical protein
MAFRKIILDNIPSSESVLTISASGIGFSAYFIKSNKLEKKVAISFYFDDEDPYRLGFEFYDEIGITDSLQLTHSKDSATKRVGATGIISKSKMLATIQKESNKNNRTFEIKKDQISKLFYVSLRPTFEFHISYTRRNEIPEKINGIYRYKDKDGAVIYIGKGAIKDRLSSPERSNWGISLIEYSIIPDDALCFKWESYYLEAYREEKGVLPICNRIGGRSIE